MLLEVVIVGMVDVDDVVLRKVGEEPFGCDHFVKIAHVEPRRLGLHILITNLINYWRQESL